MNINVVGRMWGFFVGLNMFATDGIDSPISGYLK